MQKVSKNIKETSEIAKIFLDKILKNKSSGNGAKSAVVVGLSGDLGVGKTAFTKTIAKHLGIKHIVNSPTFVIMKHYPIPKRSRYKFRFKFLLHIDAYRLESEKELLHLGWDEIINNQEYLVFVEWPENIAEVMPADSKYIYISSNKDGDKNLRNFKIK